MLKTTKSKLILLGILSVLWLQATWFFANNRALFDMQNIIHKEQQNLHNQIDYLSDSIKIHIQHLYKIPQLLGEESHILSALTLPATRPTASSLSKKQRAEIFLTEPLLKASNIYLENLAKYTKASVIFILNATGDCILSSNAYKQKSFVGSNFKTRHYYTEAIAGKQGYQYAMGRVSNLPGLFFSSPIIDQGKIVGVAIVKINLADLSPWIVQAKGYLSDEYGVIILAYDQHLEMRSLAESTINNLSSDKRLQRYKRSVFPPLNTSQWPHLKLPLIRYFDHDKQPVLMTSKRLQQELTVHLVHQLPQALQYNTNRLKLFLFFCLLGLIMLCLGIWWILAVRTRVAVENKIVDSELRLKTAQQIAQVGSFEWNIITNELQWSDEHYRLWGLKPQSITPSYELFRQIIHPDDVKNTETLLNQALQGGQPYNCEHRVVYPDGHEQYIHGRGEVIFDKAGKAIQMSGTVQDITDRKQIEKSLIAARNDANKANQAKSMFLSKMSHQLHTPIHDILAFSQLIELENTLSQVQKQHIEEIIKSSNHLLKLIDDILDLSRLESGNIDVTFEAIDVLVVVEECLLLVAPLAKKYHVQLSQNILKEVLVHANHNSLKQVLLHLLSNAIKYNCDGGSVNVKIQPQSENCLRIIVQDTGQGISSEQLPELFQPFNHFGFENNPAQGTGIGLSLAQRITETMGGKLDVESKVGAGSNFWIELPLAKITDLKNNK